MSSKPKLSRILLKLSGEVLANKDGFGIETEKVLTNNMIDKIVTLVEEKASNL